MLCATSFQSSYSFHKRCCTKTTWLIKESTADAAQAKCLTENSLRRKKEGRRKKEQGTRKKEEGRRKKEQERKKEGRKEEVGRNNRTQIRMSHDSVSKQRTTCPIILRPLIGMSRVLCKNDYEWPMVKTEGARNV